ncbi:ankyrin repeat-containing domain protein [Flagelloscypha sp. PMI_526]|nr:ankyrin repeat-containing domain protein [Flagelloscypha sp. PMI_526]
MAGQPDLVLKCIPPNPDISGVGVRTAIYVQNLLSFVPAIWAILDGKVDDFELESLDAQSTTILITAFAILISAIVQVRTEGITIFHTMIILNLSWMNNTNTFIYFLLYVHHRAKAEKSRLLWSWSNLSKSARRASWGKEKVETSDEDPRPLESKPPMRQRPSRPPPSLGRRLLRGISLPLGSLHLTVMGALGIWLWSNPEKFGKNEPLNCLDPPQLSIAGSLVSINSKGLRIFSLCTYAAILLPTLNVFVPAMGFSFTYMSFSKRFPHQALYPVIAGLFLLAAVNVVFIIDTELTIARNKDLYVDGEENDWTFGQTLALVLLLIPLRDVLESFLKRQDDDDQKKYTRFLQKLIWTNSTKGMQHLIARGADVNYVSQDPKSPHRTALEVAILNRDLPLIRYLLEAGANTNYPTRHGGTPLQLACHSPASKFPPREKYNVIRALLDHGSNPSAITLGNEDGNETPPLNPLRELLSTDSDPKPPIDLLRLLIAKGADVNRDYPVVAACRFCDLKTVQFLIGSGANLDVEDPVLGTPLSAARKNTQHGKEIARFLVKYEGDDLKADS